MLQGPAGTAPLDATFDTLTPDERGRLGELLTKLLGV
jgi:hypothetical protein